MRGPKPQVKSNYLAARSARAASQALRLAGVTGCGDAPEHLDVLSLQERIATMLISRFKRIVCSAVTIALLTSCAGRSSTPLPFQQNQSHAGKAATASCPCLYVANDGPRGDSSVTVYSAGARGNAKPKQIISGSNTGLSASWAVAVGADGKMYVANATGGGSRGHGSVTVYAAGATGNVVPMQTISGLKTRLSNPLGVALDPVNGDIYVESEGCSSPYFYCVEIFASGANGDVAPTGIIRGEKTELSNSSGIALDSSGNLYVANYAGVGYKDRGAVTVYAAGSAGNIAPTRTISGSNTGLYQPETVALDTGGDIYVPNGFGAPSDAGSVTVYAPTASGNAAPIRTIQGAKTKLDEPLGIALDGSGNIYVGNYESNTVTIYAASANGHVKPINKIRGTRTGLSYPTGIAFR
jgi:hypothetical protein